MVKTIGFHFEQASASLTIWDDGSATLSSVYSRIRNKGHGNRLMRVITEYADANDIRVKLMARPYHAKGLDRIQLINFYHNHGFRAQVISKEGTWMARNPNVEETIRHVETEALEEAGCRTRQGY